MNGEPSPPFTDVASGQARDRNLCGQLEKVSVIRAGVTQLAECLLPKSDQLSAVAPRVVSRPNRLTYTLWVLREVGSSRLKISESLADTDVDDAALTIQVIATDLATVDVTGGSKCRTLRTGSTSSSHRA